MNFFDPDDYPLEHGLTDFPLLPPVSHKLKQFLESVTLENRDISSPPNERSTVQLSGLKRSGFWATECESEAKTICRRLLLDTEDQLELLDDDLHPRLMKKHRELNHRRLQKLQFQKNIMDEKLSRIRREEEEEVKALEDQLESRKKRLLSEMLNQLESQKSRVQQQLKGSASATVKNSAATLNAGVNSNDNVVTHVQTRTFRKRVKAEAAAMGAKSSLAGMSGLDASSSVLSSSLTLLSEQKLLNESSSMAGHLNCSNSEPLDVINSEHSALLGEEGPIGDYGEMPPRMKGTGNSIAITGNGYRVDSLLAKLDIKLPDDQILNDLLIITQGRSGQKTHRKKGKYKSSSSSSTGSNNQTQGSSSGKVGHTNSGSHSNSGIASSSQSFDTTPSGSGTNGIQNNKSTPATSHKTGVPFSVYIEDKNLIYNSMTFCKGQQVYIEGQMRGNFTILTINQTEIQLRKMYDSTKIKISLDMLRRGVYKLVLR